MADDTGGKINFFSEGGNDQEQDYHWLGAAIGGVTCPDKHMPEAALAPGWATGWHGGDWLRLWPEERESFVRKLASAISVERNDR